MRSIPGPPRHDRPAPKPSPEPEGWPRARLVRRRLATRVVGFDDVDPGREVDDASRPEMRALAVQGMWHVSQPAHSMDQVHGLLGLQEWRDPIRDEEPDHLAFQRL